MLPSLRHLSPSLLGALVLVACGGGNAASGLAKAPEFEPRGQSKCGVEKSQAKPLIVEWPSADRGELEAQAHERGLVVVSYSGCEMRVLDRCTTKVKYGYAPITRKKDRVQMRDADDLFANIPVGAARFEAKLEKSGELDVDMTLVGRWEAERASVRPDELQGECAGATHVVYAMTVGSFTFTAGADATVGGGATALGAGAGATSSARRETLNADGEEAACAKSSSDDRRPPEGCGAILRLEVAPLSAGGPAPAARAEVPPSPPDGALDLTGDWASECENGATPLRTTIHVTQTGDTVKGSWDAHGRREGKLHGHTLTGTWSNDCGNGPCSGEMIDTISEDGRSSVGSWGFGSDALGFKCHATRL